MQLFETLKRQQYRPDQSMKALKTPEVFFQLSFNEEGAYLSVIDHKSHEIDPDYRAYHGVTRDILKMIQHIREKNSFLISWENAEKYKIARRGAYKRYIPHPPNLRIDVFNNTPSFSHWNTDQ